MLILVLAVLNIFRIRFSLFGNAVIGCLAVGWLIWRGFVMLSKQKPQEERTINRNAYFITIGIVLLCLSGFLWFLYSAFENVQYN